MSLRYRVKQGDCISSIADAHGHLPDTIWFDPDNSGLREKRGNRDVLYEGDIVIVREKNIDTEAVSTDTKHVFRRKGIPKKMKVQFLLRGEPRASQPYRLELDGHLRNGKTDANGWTSHLISPQARIAVFIFEDDGTYTLELGLLDPVTETSGVQARLRNLGFYCGECDGNANEVLELAIRKFQESEGLDATGRMNATTENALKEAAGGD